MLCTSVKTPSFEETFNKTSSHWKHIIIFIETSKERILMYDSAQTPLNLCQRGFGIRGDLLLPGRILVKED